MIRLKKYVITLIFTGTIMTPVVANAAVTFNNQAYIIKANSITHKPLEGEERIQKIKEDYFEIFEKADKYSPGIKLKGEELYKTRHELRKELKESIIEKRNGHLDERSPKPDKENLEENRDLRDKHRFKDEKMKVQNEKTRDAYRDFVKAVESGDKDLIKKTFMIFEENSNSLNELMRNKIKEIKEK